MDAFSSTPDGMVGVETAELTKPIGRGLREDDANGTVRNLMSTVNPTPTLDALTWCSHLRSRTDVLIFQEPIPCAPACLSR